MSNVETMVVDDGSKKVIVHFGMNGHVSCRTTHTGPRFKTADLMAVNCLLCKESHEYADELARQCAPVYPPTPAPVVFLASEPEPKSIPWQDYILSRFSAETYVDLPEFTREMIGMWRHATWECFVHDTMNCYGTQMATLLSMLYKPKVIAEFGIYAGLTTLQFCKLNPDAIVFGVDINSRNPNTNLPIAFHVLMNNVTNLNLVLGRPSWEFALPGQVDLCFIDGDHLGDSPWKDTLRAWDNRDISGDWCIAWDDYHPNNPDVKNAVDRFVADVKMELHQVGSWFYIGTMPHEKLRRFGCTT